MLEHGALSQSFYAYLAILHFYKQELADPYDKGKSIIVNNGQAFWVVFWKKSPCVIVSALYGRDFNTKLSHFPVP